VAWAWQVGPFVAMAAQGAPLCSLLVPAATACLQVCMSLLAADHDQAEQIKAAGHCCAAFGQSASLQLLSPPVAQGCSISMDGIRA
jgi:hypothetical protein